MKANEFFKKHGLAEVKILLTSPSHGFFFKEDFYKHYGFDIYEDLKRLVESHELVESFGGLEMAKESLKNLPSEYQSYTMTRDDTGATTQSFKLNQAIFDVESCQ